MALLRFFESPSPGFARGEVGLVVDDDNRLLGILTKMDLVDHLTAAVGAAG